MPASLSLTQLQFGSIKGVCVFPMKRKVPCGKSGGQVSEEATLISISRLCFQKNNTQKLCMFVLSMAPTSALKPIKTSLK